MIVKFKLFENSQQESLEDKLEEQLGEEFIEEYYDDNLAEEDVKEIIIMWPSIVWDNIDDDDYVKDFIQDEIDSLTIDDYSDSELKEYIENNLTDSKEKSIIKIYNKKNKKTESEYDDDMLEDLTEKQLKKVISKDNEEDDFVRYTVEERYSNETAQDIIESLFGRNIEGTELYKIVSQYINEDDIITQFNDNTDYSRKKEEVLGRLGRLYERDIQEKLLEIDEDNILLLAEYLEETGNKFDDYDLQKKYIKKYVENNSENNSESNLRAIALKFLHDSFKLDPDVKEEYVDDLWLINIEKYNL